MKRSFNPSAAQMALISGFGGFIAACASFALVPSCKHELGTIGSFTAFFALIIIGFAISFKAANDLKTGIAQGRWNGDEITALRKKLIPPRRRIPSVPILVVWFACLVLSFVLIFGFHTTRNFVSVWPFVVMLSLSQVQDAMRPTERRKIERANFRTYPPLHSNHWGER